MVRMVEASGPNISGPATHPTHPFIERLARGPIVADGAMGTFLYDKGIPFDRSFDAINLVDPALIQSVHREYLRAGAELIETNTFGANRFRLGAHGVTESARLVAREGARIARNAREEVGEAAFVAGAMGPLGKPVAPLGTIAREEAFDAYREQAEGLVEGGVDLLLIETQSDLTEATIAIEAVRSVTTLPLAVLFTFTEDLRTLHGAYPEDVARALASLPVDVIGANCSVGPQGVHDVVERMKRRTDRPLAAMPNAGLPRYHDGRFVYVSSPEYLAAMAVRFVDAGALLIGGCCGTTPLHIRRVRDALRAREASGPNAARGDGARAAGAGPSTASSLPPVTIEEPAGPAPTSERSALARKLAAKEFVVSVEIDPPRGARPKKMIEGAVLLKRAGVDTINVADSPMARIRMSSIALASMISSQVGIETILHFTCRDRNLMGIQSDLMGAHALGIRNVLALTGDPPRAGDYPNMTAVFDTDSIGLLRILRRMNEGVDFHGNSIGEPTGFYLGCAVNPTADNFDRELERFDKKIEAGAEFAMTQPVYEVETLARFLKAIQAVGRQRIPILLGLLPLQSYRHAEFLHNEVPGIHVPEHARAAMKAAGDRGIEVGVEMCRELLLQARDLVEGAYLMPSFGRYEVVARVAQAVLPAGRAKI
jgi:methionine synthase I (cobalamin-dependent)/5,10-methylenetetrahydrofolate reductase